MGLLNTIETLLSVMEEQPEVMARLEPTVLQVVGHIFTQSVLGKSVFFVFFNLYCSFILNNTITVNTRLRFKEKHNMYKLNIFGAIKASSEKYRFIYVICILLMMP
jgi:hypothetical protein